MGNKGYVKLKKGLQQTEKKHCNLLIFFNVPYIIVVCVFYRFLPFLVRF